MSDQLTNKLKSDVEARDREIDSLRHRVNELAGFQASARALADRVEKLEQDLSAAESAASSARNAASNHASAAAAATARADADAKRVNAAVALADAIKTLTS